MYNVPLAQRGRPPNTGSYTWPPGDVGSVGARGRHDTRHSCHGFLRHAAHRRR